MLIDLQHGKLRGNEFTFRFFDNEVEWQAYSDEYPEIVETAVLDSEERFKGTALDVFAKAVEYIPRSLLPRRYQHWIAHRLIALINEENKGKVLDYGCGAGNMGMIFAHAGFWVDFCEVKGVITDFLEWRIKRHFLKSKVYNHEDDLGEGVYDLVCMQNVIEHLDTPLEVIQKVTRSLKKGGYFFFTCNTSGKGLDVVSPEILEKVLMPYILSKFDKIPNTDDMLYKKI